MTHIKTLALMPLFIGLSAQILAQNIAIFPQFPFDVEAATALKYSKASVFVNQYEKGETDEPGYNWSIQHGDGYQYARYSFFEGKTNFETRYRPNGNKEVSWEYTYREGLLSVIDEVYYDDTLQKPEIRYSYIYHYDAQSNPFQKIVQFNAERNFRLLYDYSFDSQRRPVREKISASGIIKKWDNIQGLVPGRQEQMTLIEYRNDMKIFRVYENQHRIVEVYQTIYDTENKLPQTTEILDANRKVQYMIDYDYEDGKLRVETRYRMGDEPEPVLESMTHYLYDSDGLLERKLVEVGNLQTVYSFSYFME